MSFRVSAHRLRACLSLFGPLASPYWSSPNSARLRLLHLALAIRHHCPRTCFCRIFWLANPRSGSILAAVLRLALAFASFSTRPCPMPTWRRDDILTTSPHPSRSLFRCACAYSPVCPLGASFMPVPL
ncbi:hypothetical protein K458DRAFT_16013 [Lentithecium fluviatile CBS 122367]|uniref:Uncharacterized protein n=1 Tax=Lentithecium fluviatile CBS 122367 TaxID=1168545 RepID=A0A6G1J6D4_9PLEO|nr:hypothetical protein K458DRAFT_16013 [Lentithecium fluviatile CBS 122367]